MGALFRTEMTKQWRRPRTYVALGITILIPVITAIAIKANPPSGPGGGGPGGGGLAVLSQSSGLLLPVLALRFMSRFLLVVLVALFAGDAVASEAGWGNLRAMLTRPVARSRLLLAKVESAALMALVATALIGITGLAAGTIAFGWHPLNQQSVHGLGLFLRPTAFQSTGQLLGNLALASGFVLWSLAAYAALAFMVSTMTDSPYGAVSAGVGLYVVSQILNNISSLDSISVVFPTHYMDAWTDLFLQGSGPTGDMLRGTLLQIPYVLVFGVIAWWYFRRKDVLS
jgi:ABC-2 type transport system permease protein